MNVYYADGVQFMGSCQDKYDLIMVDSTDPIGPGEGLFTREFYQSCFKALAEDGIMVNQHEGAFMTTMLERASGSCSHLRGVPHQ